MVLFAQDSRLLHFLSSAALWRLETLRRLSRCTPMWILLQHEFSSSSTWTKKRKKVAAIKFMSRFFHFSLMDFIKRRPSVDSQLELFKISTFQEVDLLLWKLSSVFKMISSFPFGLTKTNKKWVWQRATLFCVLIKLKYPGVRDNWN